MITAGRLRLRIGATAFQNVGAPVCVSVLTHRELPVAARHLLLALLTGQRACAPTFAGHEIRLFENPEAGAGEP